MKTMYYTYIAVLGLVSGCAQPNNPSKLINDKASLSTTLHLSELHQKVITSFIDEKNHTMSILYGNSDAIASMGTDRISTNQRIAFTLVTWQQQDDPHWFGARIPGELISVETVKSIGLQGSLNYQRLKGKNLSVETDTTGNADRIHFIRSQKASFIP